jgi:hypothetical protein
MVNESGPGRKMATNVRWRMEGGTTIRSRSDAVPNNELVLEIPLLFGFSKARNVDIAVRAEEQVTAWLEDPHQFVEPGPLQFQWKVGKDRERIHQIKRSRGVRQRWLQPIRRERSKGEILFAPCDKVGIEIRPVHLGSGG